MVGTEVTEMNDPDFISTIADWGTGPTLGALAYIVLQVRGIVRSYAGRLTALELRTMRLERAGRRAHPCGRLPIDPIDQEAETR